jgi:hypothetical protein
VIRVAGSTKRPASGRRVASDQAWPGVRLYKKLRQRLFFGASNINGFAIDDLRDIRRLIVQIANQDCLRWAHDDTRGFKTDIDAMRAEITFLRRMIFDYEMAS